MAHAVLAALNLNSRLLTVSEVECRRPIHLLGAMAPELHPSRRHDALCSVVHPDSNGPRWAVAAA